MEACEPAVRDRGTDQRAPPRVRAPSSPVKPRRLRRRRCRRPDVPLINSAGKHEWIAASLALSLLSSDPQCSCIHHLHHRHLQHHHRRLAWLIRIMGGGADPTNMYINQRYERIKYSIDPLRLACCSTEFPLHVAREKWTCRFQPAFLVLRCENCLPNKLILQYMFRDSLGLSCDLLSFKYSVEQFLYERFKFYLSGRSPPDARHIYF